MSRTHMQRKKKRVGEKMKEREKQKEVGTPFTLAKSYSACLGYIQLRGREKKKSYTMSALQAESVTVLDR